MKNVKTSTANKRHRGKIVAAVLKHKLDRRRVYCVGMWGELAILNVVTVNCSGCSCDCGDGYGCSHGCCGCKECGYTGKRKDAFPDPVKIGDGYLQITPTKCSRCGKRMKHFDAGCKTCADDTSGGW